MISQFLTLYSADSPSWTNMTSLTEDMGWTDMVARSTAEYLDLEGISRKFSREVIEAATRVNYGQVTSLKHSQVCEPSDQDVPVQNLDEIHALEGMCSMAASGASSVKGGNFQLFQHFLARSGANVHLNTQVFIYSTCS